MTEKTKYADDWHWMCQHLTEFHDTYAQPRVQACDYGHWQLTKDGVIVAHSYDAEPWKTVVA